ncbi:PaaX family transcriptional regulator C-terminal domain-containing protein [Actinomadura sp. CNU-125]|uniref:PaaX family transcriptional regulator n=1 Tax=Actinomadura sp. CNU-125 TaxID=1904961 RepID=UPI000AA8EA51|nr:PaaX family transcriptional regulator C-terminal domain-containing protein [Actinomadura sp. CNU-125]
MKGPDIRHNERDEGRGTAGTGPEPDTGPSVRLRPQSLMLTYLGNYVLGRDIAVFSGSFIETFARLGVGEHAVRSTLTRMVRRGLLARHRDGRRMHFGLTARSAGILHDGEERVWRRGVLGTDWDGTWTVLAFSMPESWQRVRHDLRARLTWAGFGSLGNGTWIAPSRRDVRSIAAELGLAGHLKVFSGPAEEPTDVPAMLREAFDLDAVAGGYRAFLGRWDRPDPLPGAPDDLARYLWMTTEWLQLVRDDPRLPVEHLPDGWPAVRGQQVLLELRDRYERGARRLADAAIESIPVPPPAAPDTAEAG